MSTNHNQYRAECFDLLIYYWQSCVLYFGSEFAESSFGHLAKPSCFLMKYAMTLRLGRTILAIVIGLSVAILPASAGYAASTAISEMSASAAMPDCDHDHGASGNPAQKTTHGCADMATCALSCFNFTATASSDIIFALSAGAALKPVRTTDKLPARTVSAPFRPPRA